MSEKKESNVFYIDHKGELLIWLIVVLAVVIISFITHHSQNDLQDTFDIFMPDVDGLIVGSPVRAMGIEIGHVVKIIPIKDEVYVRFVITDDNSSDGTADGHIIWTSGKECHTDMSAGAGGIFRISGPLSLYVGSGYGSARTLWEDASGKWAEVSDYSAKGLCVDSGIIFSKGHFSASAGISTISLKAESLEIGIGISF